MFSIVWKSLLLKKIAYPSVSDNILIVILSLPWLYIFLFIISFLCFGSLSPVFHLANEISSASPSTCSVAF